MALFSFLKRNTDAGRDSAGSTSPDAIAAARTGARRRLIGAAVLLAAGVIGFPLLFETQPRPIPVDVPIEIPSRNGAPPLAMPPARQSGGAVVQGKPGVASAPAATSVPPMVTERADEQGREVAPPPAAVAPASAAVSPAARTKPEVDESTRAKALLEGKPVAKTESKPEPKPEPKIDSKPPPKADAKPAPKAEPPKPAATPAAVAAPDAVAGRFVVQVGAYGEVNGAREARQKVEKLGLKTYTQVVEVDGKRRIRVRVGPFNSRADAEKAAATIKGGGLPAALLTL